MLGNTPGKLTVGPWKLHQFFMVSLVFQPQQLPGSMLICQRVSFPIKGSMILWFAKNMNLNRMNWQIPIC
jgi:hypothetical protein